MSLLTLFSGPPAPPKAKPSKPWQPRTADDFAHAMMAKLPLGWVWPRAVTGTLYKTVRGLAGVIGRWAERVGQFLLFEAFPPSADALLPDWERVLGLPEPCLPVTGDTIAERRLKVREKLQRRPGRQDRAYFHELASRLGYVITITEYIPAQCAITQCGMTVTDAGLSTIEGAGVGTPAIRFVWSVTVTGPRLTWFAVGAFGGQTALDPHLRIARADDLECILNRFKPAHTVLIFNYTGV